jgi:hypothetical protein
LAPSLPKPAAANQRRLHDDLKYGLLFNDLPEVSHKKMTLPQLVPNAAADLVKC